MSIDEFWSLVGSGDKDTIIRALSRLSQQDIIDFEFLLRERIIECDYYDLIAALKIICGGVSDDSYLYFRCWLIGKGRRIFESALRQADSISDALGDTEMPDFEALLYVATEAYEMKTGKKEDSTFPRAVCLARGLDYDCYAPPTKGTDFRDEELPTRCPRLWKRWGPRRS